MQNDAMTQAQMLAMDGEEAFYGPLIVFLTGMAIVALIVIAVKWSQKRRADKAQTQDSQ